MSGKSLSDVLSVLRDQQQSQISAFNAENKPVMEWTGDDFVCGVFLFGDRIFYGTKYKKGYHPMKLIEVPSAVVDWIKKGTAT